MRAVSNCRPRLLRCPAKITTNAVKFRCRTRLTKCTAKKEKTNIFVNVANQTGFPRFMPPVRELHEFVRANARVLVTLNVRSVWKLMCRAEGRPEINMASLRDAHYHTHTLTHTYAHANLLSKDSKPQLKRASASSQSNAFRSTRP